MTGEATPLGLPSNIRACLFDLDGVLTETATLHARAWQQLFDEFLRVRAAASGAPFVPFDLVRDFSAYVNGRRRADGARSFLASRGITLPEGNAGDPSAETVQGLSARKDILFHGLLRAEGVHAFPGSLRYVNAVRDAGLRRAVVSSSRSCRTVLMAAGLADLFEVAIDGVVAADRHLAGKPAPDMYLAAARALGVEPSEAAVFEDAPAGVQAGRAGRFGFVVGVDRGGQSSELRRRGADVVVRDLADLSDGP